MKQQDILLVHPHQQQYQSSHFGKQPESYQIQNSGQNIPIDGLLFELQELKNKVSFLQDENAKLVQLKIQMLAECSIAQELKCKLADAENEMFKLHDQVKSQHDYINSLERAGSPILECARKSAKLSHETRHVNNTSNLNQNNNLFNTQPQANTSTSIESNNHALNNISNNINSTGTAGADCSTNGGSTNNPKNILQNENRKKIIQVIDTDLKTVKDKIKASSCKNFTLRQNSQNGPIKIAITSSTEIPKIRESLTTNNLSFHEYKWQEEKHKCFVIRGLVGATSDDIPYIKQVLMKAGLPDSISLLPLFTGYMKANPDAFHNTLFKLIVPPNFDEKLLLGIKYLDHVAVRFEVPKKNSVMQCKNCQRFGHSAGGCQHPHRCVKCGENHFRDNCPRTHNKAFKLKCCNCGGEHSANNLLHCQFFLQRYVKNNTNSNASNNLPVNNNTQSAKKIVSNISNNIQQSSSMISPGLSFAQVTGNRRNNSNFNYSPSMNSRINTSSSSNIEQKIDMLIQLVSRHDAILQKLTNNG